MRKHLRHIFVPHEGNQYHAHALRPHRALFWSAAFLAMKCIVVVYAVLIPAEAFVMPDVLAQSSLQVEREINTTRTTLGISKLTHDLRLESSAFSKSSNMAEEGYFSHTAPDGTSLADLLKKERYPYIVAGENLAVGFTNAYEVTQAWKESPTHYANIVDPEYADVGVAMAGGVYNGVPVVFTVAHFGSTKIEQSVYSIDNTQKEVAGVIVFAATSTTKDETIQANTQDGLQNDVRVDAASSLVFVDRQDDNVTFLASVSISGDVEKADVRIGDIVIPLERVNPDGAYEGTITVSSSFAGLHNTFSPPLLVVTDSNGTVVKTEIGIEGMAVQQPSAQEKYIAAKELFGSRDMVFLTIRFVYIFGIVVFAFGLLLHVLYDVRRHVFHHVTVQTLGLLMLLSSLLIM